MNTLYVGIDYLFPTIDMTKKVNFGLKEKCVKFYGKREGERVLFTTFYNRVRLNPQGDMAELILPKIRKSVREKKISFTGVYADEMQRWYDQLEPKAGKQVFYGRIRIGYSKEEAILTGDKWQEVLNNKPQRKKIKQYIPTKQEKEIAEENYTGIDITYPKEVARVFRKEYQNIISDLERKLTQVGEKDDVKELNDKLELAKAELELFNSYNPR